LILGFGEYCYTYSLIIKIKRRVNNMGWVGYPVYGEDLGSAIETAEKVIAKIKTNKFDKKDLVELDKALTEIKTVIAKDED
jgi:hypothetical protein